MGVGEGLGEHATVSVYVEHSIWLYLARSFPGTSTVEQSVCVVTQGRSKIREGLNAGARVNVFAGDTVDVDGASVVALAGTNQSISPENVEQKKDSQKTKSLWLTSALICGSRELSLRHVG